MQVYTIRVALFYQTASRYMLRAYSTNAAQRKRFEHKVLCMRVNRQRKKCCTKLGNIRGYRKARRNTKLYSTTQTTDTL